MAITTKFYTWTELWAKLMTENDLDADDEFVDITEAMGWANDAIDEAEALIMTLYEDYFLARDTITLVAATDNYSLPGNIYAHKIRYVGYFNGTKAYEIKRIRDPKKFSTYRAARANSSAEDYQYIVYNAAAATPKILLTPTAQESGVYVEVWFIRQANRLTTGADSCDIPEFHSFIMDYLAERLEAKRASGSPRHVTAATKLEITRGRMVDTLTAMTPDGDNEIPPDFSVYDDMA